MLSRNKTDENNMSELRMIKKQKLLILLMTTNESADHNNIFYTFQELSLFLIKYSFILYDNTIERKFFKRVFYSHGEIFFQNPKGARYLDAKYSRWMSTDPALGEYVPQAPVNDEAKKYNENLPGMGGLFNTVNLNLYHYAGNNPIRYTDPDGRKIFDSNWWRRNRDELIGIGLDSLEIITGIVGLEVTFGVSSLMVIQGSANAGWKIIKIIVTTYIADVDGDEKADYVDSILPESAMGAAFYGLAYLVTKIDGSNYKDEQFCEMMGKIGDLFDMVVGLGLSFKLDKQISNLISQDASMLTNLQKVLKYNKENVIATIGEEGYQLFSNLVLVDNLNNDINDYYYNY